MVPKKVFPGTKIMGYREARPLIKSGDIILFSGEGFSSSLIKKFSSSVWSHVAIVSRIEESDRVLLFESTGIFSGGVQVLPLSRKVQGYKGRVLVTRHRSFDPALVKEMNSFAFAQLGLPYDRRELIRIAMRYMGIERSERHNRRFICSELGREMLMKANANIPYQGEMIVPAHFAEEVEMVFEIVP